VNQWVWNLRLELGQHLSAMPMRTTEFAAASEPVVASGPVTTGEYGPPQWARRSFTGGFPGSAFLLQSDGTLLCPTHHPLYPQERRPERDGSYRLLYAARIGDCRRCELRAHCQESSSTVKLRRVSAVFWPQISHPQAPSAPVLGPPQPLPPLWHDWPRRRILRN
jgi:hypothetical protein